MDNPKLILASRSPRRAELLSLLGVPFEVKPVVAQEVSLDSPHDTVTENARLKAYEASQDYPDRLILTGDTIVDLNDIQIEKPADMKQAREMLRILSGKTHRVTTGVAMSYGNGRIEVRTAVSHVHFLQLSDSDIDNYLHRVKVTDKAGAYGIQEHGYILAEKVTGEFSNVMGLPLSVTFELIRLAFELGFV